MNIHRLYWPVHVLGPGARLGIWTRGCPRSCEGCMSEDLKQEEARFEVPVAELIQSVDALFGRYDIEGVTISGGEPLLRPAELFELIDGLRRHTADILLYTGYTKNEIEGDKELMRAAGRCGAVVCGPYIKELNDGRALRGSSNQEIIFFNPDLAEKYAPVLEGERGIQIGQSGSSIFLMGLLG